ncbi:acpP [Symbiodinium sp. CCMP2592]|nr:acpP [Symbiodinium sp. CCMP2592]
MAAKARAAFPAALLLMMAVMLFRSLTFVSPTPAFRTQRVVAVLRQAEATAETAGKVAEVIAEQLGVDKEKVTREATLSELGADSLDIVESVMALEEAFDMELPDEETTTLKNVGDVMDLIQSKL